MASMRRIEANRRNATQSTGPKTAEGKARVAQNPVVVRPNSRAARERPRWVARRRSDSTTRINVALNERGGQNGV